MQNKNNKRQVTFVDMFPSLAAVLELMRSYDRESFDDSQLEVMITKLANILHFKFISLCAIKSRQLLE